MKHILVISRVRGPYGKLWTEFSPFLSLLKLEAEKMRIHNLPYEPSKRG